MVMALTQRVSPAYFNLDPNRVLDITLDCYESNLTNKAYHRLIERFSRTSLVHVLGFKFQYYKNPSQARRPPTSLFDLTAHLTKAGLVDVSSHTLIFPCAEKCVLVRTKWHLCSLLVVL